MTNPADLKDFVLRGGWFALEQSGRLVTEATTLFQAGSYSTAAGLALLSREELAKSRKLFALWMRANRGAPITRRDVDDEIDMSHEEKQRHGASMFSISVDAATLEIITKGRDASPDEYAETTRRVHAMFERLQKRAPDLRRQQREQAFYVDPKDGLSWSRPSDMTKSEVEQILDDAQSDYWQHRTPGMPAWTSDLTALHEALAAWTDRPPLPPAEWPKRAS